MPLTAYHHISSETGLSSITSLIVGTHQNVIIDPPFLIKDAESVVSFVKSKSSNPVAAVFVTHHHPDHYFSANPILDAFPEAVFYAAPYVRAGIDREYDEKVVYWPTVFGKENVPAEEARAVSVFILLAQGERIESRMPVGPRPGRLGRPHSVLAAYGTHNHHWRRRVRVEEIETPAILHAWYLTLDFIEALNPVKIIVGHLEAGWELSLKEDIAHMRKYLDTFSSKITDAPKKPTVDELYQTFKTAFPQCEKNLDFFLGHLSNQFGESGQIWEENRHHNVGARTQQDLEGFVFGLGK